MRPRAARVPRRPDRRPASAPSSACLRCTRRQLGCSRRARRTPRPGAVQIFTTVRVDLFRFAWAGVANRLTRPRAPFFRPRPAVSLSVSGYLGAVRHPSPLLRPLPSARPPPASLHDASARFVRAQVSPHPYDPGHRPAVLGLPLRRLRRRDLGCQLPPSSTRFRAGTTVRPVDPVVPAPTPPTFSFFTRPSAPRPWYLILAASLAMTHGLAGLHATHATSTPAGHNKRHELSHITPY